MINELQQHVDHDTVGRLIAYGGGSVGVGVTKMAEIAQQSPVYDWGYWMFGAAILGRLVFDVYKYLKGNSKE
ncbi:MAG: hypothetical protein WC322_02750 [Candidatus Paceibacterota bacterium]|jgi:hypothetical protein